MLSSPSVFELVKTTFWSFNLDHTFFTFSGSDVTVFIALIFFHLLPGAFGDTLDGNGLAVGKLNFITAGDGSVGNAVSNIIIGILVFNSVPVEPHCEGKGPVLFTGVARDQLQEVEAAVISRIGEDRLAGFFIVNGSAFSFRGRN